ncbi:MAG TPA: UdgX family uracil-DNA binding protein [Acidobacteriaceae bacterium]|jgi:DNA polymerase
MRRVFIESDFETWRGAARDALAQGLEPDQLDLQDAAFPLPLALDLRPPDTSALEPPRGQPIRNPHVPRAFLEAAKLAAAHRSPSRWNLLFRLLHRLQSRPDLLRVEVDDDVAALRRLASQVQRDLHKMHAFVRFRRVEEPGLSDGDAREHFIAWYRPDHRIVPLAAPFFAERFAVMRWTILTPDQSMSWEPYTQQLTYGPGAGRETAPQEDELEKLWLSYYGSIFNPARLNPAAMRSEMPIRFWTHLPEIALLPDLMQRAEVRVQSMVTRQSQQPTAAPFVPEERTLPILRAAMPKCEGCDLFRCATQVVPGIGSSRAKLMLVGEQPGDQEDKQGEPFVGPAGHILRKAMEELGIASKHVFMTNAVKHFKFVQRGKLRLHQNPRMSEINACRPWLLAEMDAVRPKVVLCLGASASKSLLGGTFALMKERGTFKETQYAERVLATVHPSAVLRARDEQSRAGLYQFLKDDLALAYTTAMKS